MNARSTRVARIHWVIVAISKHIVAEDALAGGDVDIGVDEAAYCRIIISALQVIEASILSGRLAIQSNFAPCGDSKMLSLRELDNMSSIIRSPLISDHFLNYFSPSVPSEACQKKKIVLSFGE